MIPEVAFCYAWYFSQRKFLAALVNELSKDNEENVWIGVKVGNKYCAVSVEKTNDFIRKYLK